MARRSLRRLIRPTFLLIAAAACSGSSAGITQKDQIAIYSAALRTAADSLLPRGSGARLLLDPRLLPERFVAGSAGNRGLGMLDSLVVRQLPVAGVCIPTAPRRECGPGVRGLAAQLSVISRDGAGAVSVWLWVAPVQGAGDNTALAGGHAFRCLLQGHGGAWRVVRASRAIPA